MVRRALALLVVLLAGSVAHANGQTRSAQAMYADAMAKEKAVRDALDGTTPPDAVLKATRTVVSDYEAIVRRYPRSGYCDNALWNAAQLLIAVYEELGDEADRDKAVRLLKMLASEYPHSRLATEAPRAARAIGTPEPRPSSDNLATIRNIRRVVTDDSVRVSIELDAEVSFSDDRLANPERIFVDLSPTRVPSSLLDRPMRFDDEGPVREIRLGRHPGDTVRIVLDVTDIKSYSIYAMYDPYRLVIDCVTTTAKVALRSMPIPSTPATLGLARTPSTLSGRSTVPGWTQALAAAEPSTPGLGLMVRQTTPPPLVSEALPGVMPTLQVPITPPSANLNGGFSIARQLGLSVSRIVIDPGHGGHDPGAKTRGLTEADLVLDVSLRLEKLLRAVPGIDVILTRRTDTFVPLEERTAIANRHAADLFLSIHANASQRSSVSGVETYFLNFATNLSAAAVAARENAASGQAMGALPDFVKSIALNNKLDESRDLATYVQTALIDQLKQTNKGVKDLGVKQAPFVVLIGAAMPSVLSEVSFLSNPQESKLLRAPEYREDIAKALFSAVQQYQASLKSLGDVAQR